ncbi:MAG: hypothetical protein H6Q96_390, partial [Nitrospirae bacterium]|nr:hypothetical protein [Nitrospirota bacterium]
MALLFAGLLSFSVTYAQTSGPTATGQQNPPRIARAGDDYITLNFSNIDIAALVKV